ncbi:XRE family transcriptional regulator [Bifidobacterium coryneforme]|uniref:XRE family transcriptional regulator n=1 Tax=Bifidobacterium coryneforme TaxID=1687 RepID=UPI0023F562AC|nr:XRE family transcriptional regulator [Bifidobacterium coryneforme]
MSNMKKWLKNHGIPYSSLAVLLGQSSANISNKVNGITPWQEKDLLKINEQYGLSADFVINLPRPVQEMEVA